MLRSLSLGWLGMTWLSVSALVLASLFTPDAGQAWGQTENQEPAQLRQQAAQLSKDGNWQDALKLYEKLLVDKKIQGTAAAELLSDAYQCLAQLSLIEQLDPLIAKTLAVHEGDWRVLHRAAMLISEAPAHGQLDGEVFVRVPRQPRNMGRWVVSNEQDRLQALKWLEQALKLCGELPSEPKEAAEAERGTSMERARLWTDTLTVLLRMRTHKYGWRLQLKTDIQAKIEFDPNDTGLAPPERDAPVDEKGEPILYVMPGSWATATNDGQRCRWAVERAQGLDHPESAATALHFWAGFLQSQFAVDTLQQQLWVWSMQAQSGSPGAQAQAGAQDEQSEQKFGDEFAAMLELHTLADDETIAKLAGGIRRFKLPAEHNPIALLKTLAAGKTSQATTAVYDLVTTYLNRRQHPKAVQLLKDALAKADANDMPTRSSYQARLDDITLARGKFESLPPQTVGQPVKLELNFRNAKSAKFTAHRIDLEKVLRQIKADARRAPQQPTDLLYVTESPGILIDKGLDKYVSEKPITWSIGLEPEANHWDKRLDINTPINKSGMYLVEVSLDNGIHRAMCSLWVNDLAIVHKSDTEDEWFYVADAVSGRPLADRTLEFIGVGYKFSNVAKKTNAQGQVRFSDAEADAKTGRVNTWLVVARDEQGRLAVCKPSYLGQNRGGWASRAEVEESIGAVKAYGVVEQPIYRPGHKVKAKLWLGRVDYAKAQPVSNKTIRLSLRDPRGKPIWTEDKTTNEWGSVDIAVDLADSAALGLYVFTVEDPQLPSDLPTNMRFRLEEFRKPEFEVQVEAPAKGVKLGETIEAKIRAKYYFGTPVTDANVVVRVTRTRFVDDWYPVRPFDWCYGRGYWWFGYNYPWYPNWDLWQGCLPVPPIWRPWSEPPEIVLDQEVKLDAEGVATIRIDTAVAAKFQSKQDHQYSISVEVRDASRRTITANGTVVAARQPFKIYSWLNRGFYRLNETVEASFVAQTLDRQPVPGSGKLDLLRVTYGAQRQPQETVVESWEVKTNADGNLTHKLVVRRGGQYRLRLTLKDTEGHEVEGAYLFTVRGDNQSADNFRFSELELIPDKAEYAPGERVELQINADRADAHVLVLVRPKGGLGVAPQLIQLANKTARLTIDVQATDQPNFFVEALTIYNGRVYQSVREIFVPPARKVLEVKVTADKKEYLPGEKARLAIEVKDLEGKPVVGDVLLSVYDRALEQLASDTLPPDIREFFWKWRRSHYPMTDHTLDRPAFPQFIKDVPWMSQLGMFDGLLGQAAGMGDMGMGMGMEMGGMGGMGMGGMGMGMGMPGMMGGGMGGMMDGGMMGGGMTRGMSRAAVGPMGAGFGAAEMSMVASAPQTGMEMAADVSGPGAGQEVAATQVRKEFADSALWLTNVRCDRHGRATAELTMPENLTDWQIRAWSVDANLSVGSGAASAVTHKNILVRLTAPRFLTQRDQVMLSAIVHNDFDTAQDVQVRLEIDGETQLKLAADMPAKRTVRIEAHQQQRVDWLCHALAEGEVSVRAFAEAAAQSDAMQIKLPIIVHGTLKTDSWAGTIRPDQNSGRVQVKIPDQRRLAQSRLTVRVSPSLASAVVDALPYLATYPHGCTEQTLNRFLPTALAQRMLVDMNVDLKQVKEHRQNLNAQQLGDPQQRAADWKRFEEEPVYDNAEVARMVEAGVARLTEMQNPDGGWGWFYEHSSAHTTATVVRGLVVARDAGAAIVPDVVERGLAWLELEQSRRLELIQSKKETISHVDALVFHTLVMAGHHNQAMQMILYNQRNNLGVYGKVLLGLATHKLDNAEQTGMLRQNVEQFLVQDAENETAYLRDESPWWYWYGSTNESTAYYLKLIAALDPKSQVAPRLVKYLLNSRQHGAYWNSTRDTALVVEAFTDYLKATGENKNQVSGEVYLGDKRLGSFAFTPETLFTADNTIEIAASAVPSGEHTLEIRKQGAGPLFFSVYSTNFTLEEEIAPAGLEVKIDRRYYRLDPVKKSLDLAGDRGEVLETQRSTYDRVPLEDLQAVAPGTLVEVELRIESKNDYEYLLIEEPKAAGLEPVATQSGSMWENGFYAYRELRDQRLSFYIDRLPRGQHTFSYQLRAEAPGTYTALPAIISGMYAPELVGNSSDKDVVIAE